MKKNTYLIIFRFRFNSNELREIYKNIIQVKILSQITQILRFIPDSRIMKTRRNAFKVDVFNPASPRGGIPGFFNHGFK